jgi:hypothetical protein
LFDCADREPTPLAEEIFCLLDPVQEIRQAIDDQLDACLLAFNGSSVER